MTQEAHNILIETNIMLKQLLAYIKQRDGPNIDFKDFGTSFLTIALIYYVNYLFNLCRYHRIMIHY